MKGRMSPNFPWKGSLDGEQWLSSVSLVDWMTRLPQTTGICSNAFFNVLFFCFLSFLVYHASAEPDVSGCV